MAYEIMERDKTEYSSHTLIEVVYGGNRNEWILFTMSSIRNETDDQENNMKTDNKSCSPA